jgi:hypothetical protein
MATVDLTEETFAGTVRDGIALVELVGRLVRSVSDVRAGIPRGERAAPGHHLWEGGHQGLATVGRPDCLHPRAAHPGRARARHGRRPTADRRARTGSVGVRRRRSCPL